MKFNDVKNKYISKVAESFEGGIIYDYSNPKEELTMTVISNFFGEPKFYKIDDFDIIESNVEKIVKFDPEFVLKLAKYTRNVLHMRTVSTLITVIFANKCKGFKGARNWIADIIERPDDMTEMISCQFEIYGKPIPMSLKSGISKTFNKFNAYQLSKYKGNKNKVTLRDVMFLTHPKPTKENTKTFKDLADNCIEPPETWEVEISKNGSTKENWLNVIPKMGHMAMLRNLNNFSKVGINPSEIAYKFNKDAVIKGKQLPFRYYSAYKNCSDEFKPIVALCMEYSIENLPEFDGNTAILIDISGSMTWTNVSKNGSVNCSEIASVLAGILSRKCNAIIVPFGSFACIYPNEIKNILKFPEEIYRFGNINRLGCGTNINPAFECVNNIEDLNRIIILSDMQIMNYNTNSVIDSFLNRGIKVYSVDLGAYGNTLHKKSKNYYTFGGWSEKLVNFIAMSDQNKSMVEVIEDYFKQ